MLPTTPLFPFEEAHLVLLYPPFANQVRGLVLDARSQGINIGVQCGLRTYADQEKEFNIGRDAHGNIIGPTVTRARPGFSLHQYGLAVDLVFDMDLLHPGHMWSWDLKLPWDKLALLGVKHGLEAGYNWPGAIQDKPHYENRYGFQISTLLRTLIGANQDLKAVWSLIDHSTKQT